MTESLWASSPSVSAKIAQGLARFLIPCFEKEIRELRVQKCSTPSGEKNLALPPVGNV